MRQAFANSNHQLFALKLVNIRASVKFICIICTLHFVSACSLITPKEAETTTLPQTIDWQIVRQKLNDTRHWEISGKIGVRTPEDSFSAAINYWKQNQENFNLHLSSTILGLGATKLYGNSDFLTIEKSGDAPLSSHYPDLLISEALGIPLPLSSLTSWIKGLPAPGTRFKIEFNSQGLPKQLIQNGWQLSYSKYQYFEGIPLPGKIKLERDKVRIILAVKQWTLL